MNVEFNYQFHNELESKLNDSKEFKEVLVKLAYYLRDDLLPNMLTESHKENFFNKQFGNFEIDAYVGKLEQTQIIFRANKTEEEFNHYANVTEDLIRLRKGQWVPVLHNEDYSVEYQLNYLGFQIAMAKIAEFGKHYDMMPFLKSEEFKMYINNARESINILLNSFIREVRASLIGGFLDKDYMYSLFSLVSNCYKEVVGVEPTPKQQYNISLILPERVLELVQSKEPTDWVFEARNISYEWIKKNRSTL